MWFDIFISAIPNLTIDTRKLLSGLRDQVIKDLFNYYEGDISNEDPEVRLGNLVMIISAIKVCIIILN